MQIELYDYTNLGDRVENEDSHACGLLGDKGFYAIVADGLGGHGGGRAASELAVASLSRCRDLRSLPTAEEIRAWMEDANQQIIAKRDGPRHMKTTIVALFVWGGKAVWAHMGDSRLYHFHNGSLVDATQDHSVCQIAVKLGQISRKEIPNHPDKNKVLKVLGEENMSPEIHEPVRLRPGQHAFLLCSDGLWERLQEDEIMLDLHKSQTPQQWITYLRSRAEGRKCDKTDNNTAVAVFVEE